MDGGELSQLPPVLGVRREGEVDGAVDELNGLGGRPTGEDPIVGFQDLLAVSGEEMTRVGIWPRGRPGGDGGRSGFFLEILLMLASSSMKSSVKMSREEGKYVSIN
ncbi:hypothetical protein Cni_G03291 [Canna indica]|uniref:Uncharacterized protein n=1 Tax=Canna indica TaxID=4628 RepID=A0AAQ3JRC3_9LILI|nr:hypothetical protein Cni_G03291 [Canna indica]